jgi:hypothetical protein
MAIGGYVAISTLVSAAMRVRARGETRKFFRDRHCCALSVAPGGCVVLAASGFSHKWLRGHGHSWLHGYFVLAGYGSAAMLDMRPPAGGTTMLFHDGAALSGALAIGGYVASAINGFVVTAICGCMAISYWRAIW